MEVQVITAALAALLWTRPLQPSPTADPWFAPDKLKHFFMSAFIQSLSYGALRVVKMSHGQALATATTVTVTIGIGKEVHDRRTHQDFSLRDLAWDGIGGAAASLVLTHTPR
jgi:uncharacterized protein YfiM (DUF2279 family)